MKTLLTAVSALAIATAVPALAADVTFPEEYFEGNKAAGYVDLHYGFVWPDSELISDELRFFGIYGRGNLPFSPSSLFNLQLDGTADTVFAAGKFSNAAPIEATAHLYVRDPARFAFGAFGSYGIFQGFDIWGGGAEGQLFLDRITLYGQAGYRWYDTTSEFSEWYVRGVGRWFPIDNIRVEGEIGYGQYDASLGQVNNLFWSATAEYRFDHMPLGIYAQYRGNHYDLCCGAPDVTTNAAVFGLRAHLGSDSLFDNDRRGASFDTRAPDPFGLTALAGQRR